MDTYTNMQHPILILVRGLPGSGKSYLAAALQKTIGEEACVMLDPDGIDYESREYKDHVTAQLAEGVDPALHAYRFSRAQAYQGIEDHKIVIWNQPFTNLEIFQKMVERLETHATENHTTLPMLVVEVEIDPEIAKQRVATRKAQGGHGPSDGRFGRFVDEYYSFASEGYNVISVRGEDDTAATVAAIMDRVAALATQS